MKSGDMGNNWKWVLILALPGLLVTYVESLWAFQPPGEKLFTKLGPEETGIRFNNVLEDVEEHSILIYSNYYGGGGVGIGDINNDGLQDIFFAGNLVPDRLYLNKGNLVFEDITESAGILDNGGWSSGVLMGDVNNDGYLDIYVTRELYDEKPELWANMLYINNGDNTFTESAAEYGVVDDQRTRHATFIDYDNDGDLDLFLCTQPPNPGVYSSYYQTELLLEVYTPKLLENQGNIFVDVTEKAGLLRPGFPNSVTASDLNNDGWPDLWVANDYWAGDFIYMNNGDGTFTDEVAERVRHITYSSMGIDAADINNDGWLDIMVLDMVPEDHFRRHANMGAMNAQAFGKVVEEGGYYQYFTNTFFLNRGEGIFSDIVHLAGIESTDWSWTNLFLDLDNDGWKDLFIANGLMRDIRDLDAANEFPKVIEGAIHQFLEKNPNPEDISIWDIVDMDKAMQISPSVKLHNYAFRNQGDLTFRDMTTEWGFEETTFSNGGAYADLDNDGDLDVVVNNVNDPAMIYRNNAEKLLNNHFLRIKPVADKGKGNVLGTKVWIETADSLQFFEITSVRGMYSTSEHIAHFGLGNVDRVDRLIVRWPDGRENIEKNIRANQEIEIHYSKSRPGNGIPDSPIKNELIFEEITGSNGIDHRHEENKFDDFSRQSLLPYKMSELGPFMAAGDVDGNGLEDLFIGGSAGREGRLYFQNVDGTFSSQESESLFADKMHEDMGAAFFDVDNDGDLDLYVVSGGNEFRPRSSLYQDRLYLNDGTGNFTKTEDWLPKMNISGSVVIPHDIDRDGDMDLFLAGRHMPWSYPDPESSVILINTGEKFENMTREIAPELIGIGMVNDAVWVDFSGDGYMDLVLVGEWMPVTFFLNEDGKFRDVTTEYGLSDNTGWWFGLEAADMDNDGDMDLVAGNFGLNSYYHGTVDDPFEIYYHDFDNNGLKDIVLTYYESGIQYPYARKKDAAVQIPAIDDKFPSFTEYAKADVNDIYGKENLDMALHYQARMFESVYIENQGNGKFVFHPLPREAQFSSINDILIDDYNLDGHLDILTAGNMYAVEVKTPRNDAGIGLFLAGDGRGNFEPVNYLESGFYLPYDVKDLATIKTDNTVLILAACNNDLLRILRLKKSEAESLPAGQTGQKTEANR
jgi:enediyne biosynthesis protein E4